MRGNCDLEKRNLVCSRNKWHKAGALYMWQLWLKIGQLHADNIPQECRSCRLCQDTPNTPPAILIPINYPAQSKDNSSQNNINTAISSNFLSFWHFSHLVWWWLLKKGKLDTEILPQKLKFLFTSWVTLLHNSLINLKSLTIERNITCGIVQFLYQHIYVLVLVQCNVVILMSATGREGR